jgi:hypothetical protein
MKHAQRTGVLLASSNLRLQFVGALDDRSDVRPFPIRLDPPHALVFPSARRTGPVAPNYETPVLVAVVVASAVFPTFLAQRYFHPHHLLEAPGGEVDPELLESPKNH